MEKRYIYSLALELLRPANKLEADLLRCWNEEIGDEEDFVLLFWLSFLLRRPIVDLVHTKDAVDLDLRHDNIKLVAHDEHVHALPITEHDVPLTLRSKFLFDKLEVRRSSELAVRLQSLLDHPWRQACFSSNLQVVFFLAF